MNNLAILCSGGDCSGMNPAIKRFVEYARERGVNSYAVYDGFEGLLEDRIFKLGPKDVSGIIFRGGTVIRSSRCPQFHEASARKQAAENLSKHGIEGLVVLGGDGSFQGARHLSREFDIAAACIPATIDNDIPGTDYSLGVDTALNVIRHCIDEIRDTASSFRRAFVIEVMGRHCGYLALVSALTGGAEACLIPELKFHDEKVAARLKSEFASERRTYAIAVVCEGVKDGSQRLERMFREQLGLGCRITMLGHIQRGGSPTVLDRLRGFECATLAIDGLLEGEQLFATLARNGSFTRHPLVESAPQIDPQLLKLARRLTQ